MLKRYRVGGSRKGNSPTFSSSHTKNLGFSGVLSMKQKIMNKNRRALSNTKKLQSFAGDVTFTPKSPKNRSFLIRGSEKKDHSTSRKTPKQATSVKKRGQRSPIHNFSSVVAYKKIKNKKFRLTRPTLNSKSDKASWIQISSPKASFNVSSIEEEIGSHYKHHYFKENQEEEVHSKRPFPKKNKQKKVLFD